MLQGGQKLCFNRFFSLEGTIYKASSGIHFAVQIDYDRMFCSLPLVSLWLLGPVCCLPICPS